MSSIDSTEVTRLLHAWSEGDRDSGERLTPLIYEELRRLARGLISRERKDHTLQPTALVHEAFMKLVEMDGIRWQDRAHFFAIASRSMRQILVDHARRHRSQKRGGSTPAVSLEQVGELATDRPLDLVALDDALHALAKVDPEKASIVELRYFGGLSIEEVAEVLDTSRTTIIRRWRMAKAWLHRELHRGDDEES